jgi:REP element-mobilizing transposase RayT
MSNTYSQISLHIIFAVKHREALILPNFRDNLFRYIHGIIKGKNQKSFAVNGASDHIHIFTGLTPSIYIPDFVRDIKSDSSLYVNKNRWSPGKFHWQDGYGVFSHSRSQRDCVIKYILNQEEHHSKKSFKSEYIGFLEKAGVDFDSKYLFEFFDSKHARP